jgi:GNAT superfamily N-acetyltransferase
MIRAAVDADVPVLARLMATLGYPTDDAAVAGRLARMLPDPACAILVADADGVQGVIGLRIRPEAALHKHLPLEGEVVTLVVDADASGRGLGGALLAAAEDWFRERGVEEVRISCSVRRVDSHRFYRNRGYAESVWIAEPGPDHARGKCLSLIFKKRL